MDRSWCCQHGGCAKGFCLWRREILSLLAEQAGRARGDAGSWHRQSPPPVLPSLPRAPPCAGSTDLSLFSPQLYELDEDPKRKEFLDDLFSFMQKRGKGGWLGWAPLVSLPQLPGGAHDMVHSGSELLWVSVSPLGRSCCACHPHLLHTQRHVCKLTPFCPHCPRPTPLKGCLLAGGAPLGSPELGLVAMPVVDAL